MEPGKVSPRDTMWNREWYLANWTELSWLCNIIAIQNDKLDKRIDNYVNLTIKEHEWKSINKDKERLYGLVRWAILHRIEREHFTDCLEKDKSRNFNSILTNIPREPSNYKESINEATKQLDRKVLSPYKKSSDD